MKKLLLADDHDLVLETIADFLRLQGGFEVVSADALDSAIEAVRKKGPFDLVLLDYSMPGMNALAGLTQMKGVAGCPVAILSGTAPPDIARAAITKGAAGFLPKTLTPQSLVTAVRDMLDGKIFKPKDIPNDIGSSPCPIQLTPREKDVLRGISAGKSNKEIARDLNIQEVTVKLHVKTLSRKLGARNRTHAAMLGRDLRIE